MILNKTQLQQIKTFLSQNGIKHPAVKEELFDHIATQIEHQMSAGNSFAEATATTFESFQKDEMQEIQSQIFSQQKQLIMKRLSLAAMAVLLVTTMVWSFKIDPPSRSPLSENFKVTAAFGMSNHPVMKSKKMHKGIDFKVPLGTPVYATADGVISKVQQKETGYGNLIVIKHDDEYESYFGHLSELQVAEGQRVRKGDVIALSGNSGASTLPHLHYEVRKKGVPQDPEGYLIP